MVWWHWMTLLCIFVRMIITVGNSIAQKRIVDAVKMVCTFKFSWFTSPCCFNTDKKTNQISAWIYTVQCIQNTTTNLHVFLKYCTSYLNSLGLHPLAVFLICTGKPPPDHAVQEQKISVQYFQHTVHGFICRIHVDETCMGLQWDINSNIQWVVNIYAIKLFEM